METRAPRNRTLTCSQSELVELAADLLRVQSSLPLTSLTDRVIHQDCFEVAPNLPANFVDLLILDPPYNLTKEYHGEVFRSKSVDAYSTWFEAIISGLLHTLKADASIYVCSDWRTSAQIFPILDRYFIVRNRITWEREKGRGAKTNWKNTSEDIWFCTRSNEYFFNSEAVKLKRRVIAPYRLEDGSPKDWEHSAEGNYRLTHPSNLWTDITVPFWSMPENTDHPTQKPEKLLAKLILASSREGDFVLDPFLGSGTTAVVARKLGRHFCGIESNQVYACWALKRLGMAESDGRIQGYEDGVFRERNTQAAQTPSSSKQNNMMTMQQRMLFDE